MGVSEVDQDILNFFTHYIRERTGRNTLKVNIDGINSSAVSSVAPRKDSACS